MPLLIASNLSKSFGNKLAVDSVSLSLDCGEVLAFIGPNGAGKSTTMRMISGFIMPTNGNVKIAGFDISTHPIQAKSNLGYLPENAPLPQHRTVVEFLNSIAEIRHLQGNTRKLAVERSLHLCQLHSVRNQALETLSKGFKRRTCLAQAIIHDPPILILDEPTDGLDPNQKREIRNLIRSMAGSKTVIVSTHILEEVEAISTRVALINQGRILFDGTPSQFLSSSNSNTPKIDEIFHSLTANSEETRSR